MLLQQFLFHEILTADTHVHERKILVLVEYRQQEELYCMSHNASNFEGLIRFMGYIPIMQIIQSFQICILIHIKKMPTTVFLSLEMHQTNIIHRVRITFAVWIANHTGLHVHMCLDQRGRSVWCPR